MEFTAVQSFYGERFEIGNRSGFGRPYAVPNFFGDEIMRLHKIVKATCAEISLAEIYDFTSVK